MTWGAAKAKVPGSRRERRLPLWSQDWEATILLRSNESLVAFTITTRRWWACCEPRLAFNAKPEKGGFRRNRLNRQTEPNQATIYSSPVATI
jgi:hypothetical protein